MTRERDGDDLGAILRSLPRLEPGHVWLVGAGPGSVRLLTVEAVGALQQADVVVHDALISREVLDLARPHARLVFAGKRGGKPSADQRDITATLIDEARTGRRVLRLKGGDPFVFARGGEELTKLLEAGVPCRVVPGVTSGVAALAAADIPLTMRGVNQGVFLATGHGADAPATADSIDWRAVGRIGQPIVLYMAMKNLGRIASELVEGGLGPETPAAVIASATLPEERVVVANAATIAERAAGVQPPAIVVFGEIVRTRDNLRRLVREMAEGMVS